MTFSWLKEKIEPYLTLILTVLSLLIVVTLIFLIINSFVIRRSIESQYSVLKNHITHDISNMVKIQSRSAELILFYSRYLDDEDFSSAELERPPWQVSRELIAHLRAGRNIGKLSSPAVLKLFEDKDPLGYSERIVPLIDSFFTNLDRLEEDTVPLLNTGTSAEEFAALRRFRRNYGTISANLNHVSDSLGQLQNIFIEHLREANRAAFKSERIYGLIVIVAFFMVPLLLLIYYRNSVKLNRSLSSSLRQQEIQNQEINHRVKNNLLLISSLIRLKKNSGKADTNFTELEHQIDTIRFVHEQLYMEAGSGNIDMRRYISQLLGTIFNSFNNGVIRPEYTIDSVELDSRIAVPLGLIINEVATNTIKYGFSGDTPPRFFLEFVRPSRQEEYCLTIGNTGPPISDEIDPDRSKTLGLRLVKALVGQLKGSLELEKQPHPRFIIRLPVKATS